MRVHFLSVFFLLLSQLNSCRTTNESGTKMIPGSPAVSNQFPSVIKILGCSGFKVAAKSYITSARCIFDFASKGLVDAAQIGSTINLAFGIDTDKSVKKVKIVDVQVHSEFAQFLKSTELEPLDASDLKDVADIAIFDIDLNIPEIKPALISKDFWSLQLQTAIVAGYGLTSSPFGQQGLTVAPVGDLFWNRFKVVKIDTSRFYAAEGPLDGGEGVTKLMAADRGAPVFLDSNDATLEKLVGMSSGSGMDRKGYFVSFNEKLVNCIVKATASTVVAKPMKSFRVFCE